MSSSPSSWAHQPVATLELDSRSPISPSRKVFFILPCQSLKVGRDKQSNDFTFPSECFSPDHLEFYTVVTDDEEKPLLYVRDCQSLNGTFVNNVLIGKGSRVTNGRLLENGDTVTIAPHWHFKVKLMDKETPPLSDIQLAEAEVFKDQYTISNIVIGSGVSTTVRLGRNVKTGQQLACKIYDLRADGMDGDFTQLQRALKLMTLLDHPNIASFRTAYKSRHTLFVFEELAAGGDLFSLVIESVRLQEFEVRWILRQILLGLEHLHTKGIAHRDIKLENVLLCVCPEPEYRIALTDFGHARLMGTGNSTFGIGGTPGWQAPEMFKNNNRHGLAADMWSMGIMAVQLLLGRSQSEMMAKVESMISVDPSFKTLDFKGIFNEIYVTRRISTSDGPREDFIRRCLMCDPKKRMTVDEALQHPYISEPTAYRKEFERREQEIREGWTCRPHQTDLIQSLPDVLAPLPDKEVKIRPKRSIILRKNAQKKEIETAKSKYFTKVTKSVGVKVKRVRSDETVQEEIPTKRRKQ